MKGLLGVVLTLLTFTSCFYNANEGDTSFEVTVIDYDSGEPIPNASVMVGECKQFTFDIGCDTFRILQTNAEGKASLSFTEPEERLFSVIPMHNENYFPLDSFSVRIPQKLDNELELQMITYNEVYLEFERNEGSEVTYDSIQLDWKPMISPYMDFYNDMYRDEIFHSLILYEEDLEQGVTLKAVPGKVHDLMITYFADSLQQNPDTRFQRVEVNKEETMNWPVYL